MATLRHLAYLFFTVIIGCTYCFAAICTDCCYISGDPDGQLSNGTYYKDSGGLRQTQKLTNYGGGCIGGGYSSYDAAEARMYACANKAYAYCQTKGNVNPCLSLPETMGNHHLLFGTAYGHVVQNNRGRYNFGTTAYWLETAVSCIDSTIDSDGDGHVDCEDACPTIAGNAEDGCPLEKLQRGRDEKDPDLPCQGKASEQGNPTSIYSGNKMESETDLSFPSPFVGGLTFKRFYNSQSEEISPMGYGWTHNYHITLAVEPEILPAKMRLVITDETGFGRYFRLDSTTGEISALFAERTRLKKQAGTYLWVRQDGAAYTFDAQTNLLISINDRFGNQQTLIYDGEAPQRIQSVVDQASGRRLVFSYDDDWLSAIELFAGDVDGGTQVNFSHDPNGNLIGVRYAEGSGFGYEYDDQDNSPAAVPYINNMTRKSDAAGHRLSTWTYDAEDRCIHNETGDGKGVSIDYASVADAVVVTDAYGTSRTYHLTTIQGRKRIAAVSDASGCTRCVEEPVRWEYDDRLNVTEIEYANGRIDRFSDFDDRGNAGTIVRAADTLAEQTITLTWHPELNQPLTKTEQSVLGDGDKVTIWDYDNDGNETPNEAPTLLANRRIVRGYTIGDAEGVLPVASITSFSYDPRGLLLTIDGPLAGSDDHVTFTYDDHTGNLLSLSKPHSGTTLFREYDPTGRPAVITDANRNSLALTYDGRGRVSTITRQWDNAVMRYGYNIAGEIETIRLPNGAAYDFEYETDYGRLVRIRDAMGNTITSAYDGQGNVIEIGYNLPSGINTFWQGFDYQYPGHPGKLWKRINPDGTGTEYTYDAMGVVTQMIDPLNRKTRFDHDLFNQIVSSEQPDGGITTFAHDTQGNRVLVTDPENHATEYGVDDLGRTVRTLSPDSGTTRYRYDTAGNLLARTDANGIVATFEYDSEYRLTAIHYPDPAEDVTFSYDQGVNGKGRLTGMIDRSGSYGYGWDEAGNPILEQKTVDGVTYTTTYAYDPAGLMTGMTYPGGLSIQWVRNTAGQISQVTATQNGTPTILADQITALPFGPIESMILGNGISVFRSFDRQYQMMANLSTGIHDLDYERDAVGNLTVIADGLDGTGNQSFGYDALNRLTDANSIFGDIAFSYDNVGNRLNRATARLIENYDYLAGTNRLASIAREKQSARHPEPGHPGAANEKRPENSGKESDLSTGPGQQKPMPAQRETSLTKIISDAAGNITSCGARKFIYNQANRIETIKQGRVTLASYFYSADGKRVKKAVGGKETIFHYDREGHLIAESDGDGTMLRNYVYLDGVPLATIVGKKHEKDLTGPLRSAWQNGKPRERIYYYHTDHLGTPQAMTDDKGAIVWNATYDPFGGVDLNIEKAENNLRFPGQYFDHETGLHYNYHRYYDPATGRYLKPDPIGLGGGINVFAYVQNNPVNFVDPTGKFRFGTRPLGPPKNPLKFGYNESGSNRRVLHEHGFYDNGVGVGYYPQGIDDDDPANFGRYEMFDPYYDDVIMKQAEENLRKSGKWNPKGAPNGYDLMDHNCQDFADALREEYDKLGGPIYDLWRFPYTFEDIINRL